MVTVQSKLCHSLRSLLLTLIQQIHRSTAQSSQQHVVSVKCALDAIIVLLIKSVLIEVRTVYLLIYLVSVVGPSIMPYCHRLFDVK